MWTWCMLEDFAYRKKTVHKHRTNINIKTNNLSNNTCSRLSTDKTFIGFIRTQLIESPGTANNQQTAAGQNGTTN